MSLEVALRYTARGWPVFPISPDGNKRPLVKDWAKTAATDSQHLETWWQRWPHALIGLPTGRRSGVVVLDIDVKNPAAYGFDTLASLGLAILPETPMAHTRSGGLHVYFACHPAVEIRNSVGKYGLGVGVDVRGEGGLVVLPSPSSGYSWDEHWNFDRIAPIPAPFWLGHRTRPTASRGTVQNGQSFSPARALDEACNRIRTADDGEKHDTLNREAFRVGTLVRAGLLPRNETWSDLQAATAALIATSTAEPVRTRAVLESAFNAGFAAPRRSAR
jgi:putative DNA primase/helicase